MTNDIIDFIAEQLKIKIPDMKCLNYIARKIEQNIVVLNGDYAGIDDRRSVGGYIRFASEDDHTYEKITSGDDYGARRFTSSQNQSAYIRVTSELKFVISHKYNDQQGFEQYVLAGLMSILFDSYNGNESYIEIIPESSSTDKQAIIEEEMGDDAKPSDELNLLVVNFSLKYNTDACGGSNFNINEC